MTAEDETLRVLIVGSPDLESAGRLAAWMMQEKVEQPPPDACLVIGPFSAQKREGGSEEHGEGPLEAEIALEGEMTSILALLENIVCRVCFVPAHTDPASTRSSARHLPRLTPNALNVHRQLLQLLPGLFLAGFSEPPTPSNDKPSALPEQRTVVAIQGALSAREFCSDCALIMLNHRPVASAPSGPGGEEQGSAEQATSSTPAKDSSSSSSSSSSSQGALSTSCVPPSLRAYLASTQQNIVLFVCGSDDEEASTEQIGGVQVVNPGSIRQGDFATARLVRKASLPCGWMVDQVSLHRLPA